MQCSFRVDFPIVILTSVSGSCSAKTCTAVVAAAVGDTKARLGAGGSIMITKPVGPAPALIDCQPLTGRQGLRQLPGDPVVGREGIADLAPGLNNTLHSPTTPTSVPTKTSIPDHSLAPRPLPKLSHNPKVCIINPILKNNSDLSPTPQHLSVTAHSPKSISSTCPFSWCRWKFASSTQSQITSSDLAPVLNPNLCSPTASRAPVQHALPAGVARGAAGNRYGR